ncbi:MAG TPA: ATP-binding domain-containing protein, partial [Acidimicrobiales bacterium]|nr:ATP-binding domain-containing protein [Acidimicrobiales bacterium]
VRRLADDYLRTLSVHGVSSSATAPVGTGAEPATGSAVGAGGENGHRSERLRHPGGHELNGATVNGAHGDGVGSGPSHPTDRATPPSGYDGTDDVAADEASFDLTEFSRQVHRLPELAEALDRMWPRLSAEELLHDLFGAPPLLALAGKRMLSSAEQSSLYRPRSESLADVTWTAADLALLDEARVLLGPRRGRPSAGEHEGTPRTYGHIVVDEAQDLSPMQLRMVARRSLSGSITVVGDIGQATGPWAPANWDEVTTHLPGHRPPRLVELTVSYRTPAEVVEVAGRVLARAAPELRPPRPIRRTGVEPLFVQVQPEDLADAVVRVARDLVAEVSPGTAAVLAPASLVAIVALALDAAGLEASDPRIDGLGAPLSLLPVDLANGLEFDAVVVVEPEVVASESPQGLRSLYVALTRPTRRLAVVHAAPLPGGLAPRWSAELPPPGGEVGASSR